MKIPFVTEHKPYGFLIEMWIVLGIMLFVYIIVYWESFRKISKGLDEHGKKKKKLADKDVGLMKTYGRDVERARTFQSDYSRKQPKKKYGIVDNILKKYTKT